jgi:hypothetical protein
LVSKFDIIGGKMNKGRETLKILILKDTVCKTGDEILEKSI